MILTAHQSAYLPWLGYFHKIILADKFIVLDNVQFEKNSFINRNKVKTPGKDTWLTVPVLSKGHISSSIKDLKINNKTNWRASHWKTIFFNYKKAPFFKLYSDFFEDLYKKEWELLCDLNQYILNYILNELNIKKEIIFQKDLPIKAVKQDLILEFCKYFKADTFIFGKLGIDYADEDLFKKNNIKIYFQEYKHPRYKQIWKDFSPYMSIIDLMFNVDKSKIIDTIFGGNIKEI